jgi:hypothetical protein
MAVRAEMMLLREALEGVVAPEVATAVLYDALELAGRKPPSTVEEVRAFVDGALAEAVKRRLGPDDALSIVKHIGGLFSAQGEEPVSIDVDVDSFGDERPATGQMAVVHDPVPVVVLAASPIFAERLSATLGVERVKSVAARDEASLRRAIATHAPLIVLVDGTDPSSIDPGALRATLSGLPQSALAVIWGSETPWSQSLVPALEADEARFVTLERREGIEPLLDTVLARYRGGR